MYINGINFPNKIIEAANEGDLVVFAGAGVSRGEPTCLPDFKNLTKDVANGTGFQMEEKESFESFLGRLKSHNIDVNKIAAEKLSSIELKHNAAHEAIIDLFPDVSKIKIVTTNYDSMFELVLKERGMEHIRTYSSPALPLGNDVNGIIHIHGEVAYPEYMVLTDEDFGTAYLSEGYASRFLVKLFETYTVLFVGYSYNDLIVRYLTRAMTKSMKKDRFIITDSYDYRLSGLGIKPILYEKDQHTGMYEGLNLLGEHIKRGLLDWKTRFSMLDKLPPKDLSVQSELEFCLSDIDKTRVLLSFISGKEWLRWVDEKHLLDKLFDAKNSLDEKDLLWADWLVKYYVGESDDLIKVLILKHGNQINRVFAERIIEKIIGNKDLFNDEILKEYLVVLSPILDNTFTIYELIGIVASRKMYHLAWSLYKRLFSYRMILEENFFSNLSGNKITYKHRFLTDDWWIEEIWEQFSQEFIEFDATAILNFAAELIEKLHFDYVHVGQATEVYDPYEMISNISFDKEEPEYSEKDALSILTKAILITVHEEEKKIQVHTQEYIRRCIKSESASLRVIGVHLLKESISFSPDEKAELLVENIGMYSIFEKESVFQLVACIFDQLDSRNQDGILDIIESGSEIDDESIVAYQKYNWCVWLQSKCKNNSRVKDMMNKIKSIHPEFQPRDNPEKGFMVEVGTVDEDKSPVTADELKKMSCSDLKTILIEYRAEDWKSANRYGLLKVFSICIQTDFQWNLKIIDMLIGEFSYDSDVWDCYFNGLRDSNFTGEEYITVLRKLSLKDLMKQRNYNIANLVEKALKTKGVKDNFNQYREELLQIQGTLWSCRAIGDSYYPLRLIDRCFNCSTGVLTSNWITMLSYEDVEGIPISYKSLFERLLTDSEEIQQVVCILVGQIRFLHHKDRDWVKTHLIPLLESLDIEIFRAAWTGIVWIAGKFSVEMADELIPLYSSAVQRLTCLEGEVRDGFIDLYTFLLIYLIDNPVSDFIPAFFQVSEKQDEERFAHSITQLLRKLEKAERLRLWNSWLSQYWMNRTKNIPKPLAEHEKSEMLMWILEMDDLYPECIRIVLSQEKIESVDALFWVKLKSSTLLEKYPDETAQLLSFILNSGADLKYRSRNVSDVSRCIACNDIKIQRELQEALLKRGINL